MRSCLGFPARPALLLGLLAVLLGLAGTPARATAPTPFGGSPIPVAASGPTTVPATSYDLGGEGVAYHDYDNGGQSAYRPDNIGVPSASAFGWAYAGEWEGYTIAVAHAGPYTIDLHVNNAAHNGTCHLEFGPVGQAGGAGVTRSPEFVILGSGSTVGTVSVHGVSLTAGTQWMRLVMDTNGDAGYVGNFVDIALTPDGTTPHGVVSATATTRIEAEDYDPGGEGVAYHDIANGGCTAYRPDNVGIYQDSNASGGYAVYYTAAGEWYGYTLNVAQAGSYALTARIGGNYAGGRFHAEFGPVGGASTVSTAEFTIPYASGLFTYQDVSVPAVPLPAGPVWMRLVVDDNLPCTFDFFRLTPVALLPTATGLTFSPATVAGGGSVGGVVTLSGPAPGTMALALSSDSPAVQVPALVTVYAGATSGYFTATTSPVSSNTTAHVTASGAGGPVTGTLALSSTVSLSSLGAYSYIDENGSPVGYGYFGLNGPAPAGGLTVTLGSDSGSATVPASVTVPAGSNYGNFPITVSAVSAPVTAHLTASAGGVTKETDLTLAPFGLSELILSPDTVHGGDGTGGYLELNGPAPAGGLTFSLDSDSPLASVPSSVTVAEGDYEAYFPITTSAVSSATAVHITATGTGGPRSATLTLSPTSAPSGLTATAYPTGPATVVVNLNWTAAAGATGYVVERSHDFSSWTQIATPSGTSYQDAPPSGTYFYYRVKAAGGSVYSNLAYANTGFPWLVATDLAWQPDPVHAGDQVHFYAVIQNIGTAPSYPFNWSVEFEGDPGETGFNIEGNPLAPGDTLLVTENSDQYWTATPGAHTIVVVIDDSYESLSRTLVVAPAAPTGLTATAASSSEIDLTWTASAGATSYNLYRGTTSGGETLYKSGLTGTSFADTGLTAGQSYYYTASALSGNVESSPSKVVSYTYDGGGFATNSLLGVIPSNWGLGSYGGGVGLGGRGDWWDYNVQHPADEKCVATGSGSVRATLTWQPSYASDVPPSTVSVEEDADAYILLLTAPWSVSIQTFDVDDGLGDTPVKTVVYAGGELNLGANNFQAEAYGRHLTNVDVPTGATQVTLPARNLSYSAEVTGTDKMPVWAVGHCTYTASVSHHPTFLPGFSCFTNPGVGSEAQVGNTCGPSLPVPVEGGVAEGADCTVGIGQITPDTPPDTLKIFVDGTEIASSTGSPIAARFDTTHFPNGYNLDVRYFGHYPDGTVQDQLFHYKVVNTVYNITNLSLRKNSLREQNIVKNVYTNITDTKDSKPAFGNHGPVSDGKATLLNTLLASNYFDASTHGGAINHNEYLTDGLTKEFSQKIYVDDVKNALISKDPKNINRPPFVFVYLSACFLGKSGTKMPAAFGVAAEDGTENPGDACTGYMSFDAEVNCDRRTVRWSLTLWQGLAKGLTTI